MRRALGDEEARQSEARKSSGPNGYMRRVDGAKVTRLTLGDLLTGMSRGQQRRRLQVNREDVPYLEVGELVSHPAGRCACRGTRIHVERANIVNRRMPTGTSGGVGGRRRKTPAYPMRGPESCSWGRARKCLRRPGGRLRRFANPYAVRCNANANLRSRLVN
jgi:hypothetical protein